MEGAPVQQCSSASSKLKLLTLVWLAVAAQAEDQCDGPVLQLQLQGKDTPPRTLYGVLATFGGVPPLSNWSHPAQLVAAQPFHACGGVQQSQGSVYLVERGNCSFVDKYQAVLAAGGSGMILYDDVPGCITMGGAINSSSSSNDTQPQQRNPSAPPGISIPRSDGTQLMTELHAGAGLTVQWQLLDVPALDASALLLWLMAVSTVVLGALWCGNDYALELKGLGVGLSPEGGRRGSNGSSGSSSGGGGGMQILEITMTGAICFVAVSSAMLLLLYFFLNKAFFYVILVGFAAAGAQALGVLLFPLLCKALPGLAARTVQLPCGLGPMGAVELLLTPIAIAAAVVWAVCRNAGWSWVLQDVLGIAIMLLVLRTLRLPNLRVACVLLPLCFAYDVFFVFIQPMLSGGGTSIMVEVAEGGGSNEFLPMLLRVPRLSGPPIIRGSYSLLGFGDVILPGLLVALTRRLDMMMTSSMAGAPAAAAAVGGVAKKGCCCRHGGYFVPVVMGYGAGLLLTYAALMFSWFGDQGQPALLYLVPCTLGIVLLLAVVRGELHLLLDAQLDLEDSTVEVDATGGSHGTTGLDHDSTGSGAANEGVSAVAAGQQKRLWARPGADRTGSRSGSGPGAEQRVALLAGQQASGSWNGLAQQHQQQPQ